MLPRASRVISNAARSGTLYFSPISAWEIGLLVRRGRLKLKLPVEDFIHEAYRRPGVQIAELTYEIAVRSSSLPGDFHDDPVDRLLLGTAATMGLKLVTRDRRILNYGEQGYLQVTPC